MTSVTGSGFANISTYASNIQYRAWGGQKSVSYSDTSSATTSYNARMQPSSYQLSPSEFKLREQFQYYPDGRLQKMTDLDDRNADIGYLDTARHFSRAHSYDQVGRLSSATGTPATYATFPFSQNYSYDPFNNLTSRYGAYYYQTPTSDSASFSNNRRQGWDYYADGQVKHNPIAYNGNVTAFRDWIYDAAGQMVQVKETVTNPSSVSTYVTSYDGDGKQALEYYQEYPTNSKSYMVRSSVLGGKVLTRLDYAGNKWKTNFSVDGQLVAVQYGVSFYNQYATVQWTHTDPLGLSDAGDTKSVYDPLGNSISWQHAPTAPPNYYPPHSPGDSGLGSSFGFAQDKSCTFNGLPISCSDLAHQIDIGNVSAEYRRDGQTREVPLVPSGLGMFQMWVPNPDGPRLADSPPDDGVVRVNREEDDMRGHYEFFLLSVAPQKTYPGVMGNVKIVNTGGDTALERNAQDVLGRIMNMALSKDCNDAFVRAGLATPNDQVQKGIILASRRALTNSAYNSALGITEDIRAKASKSNAPLQTIGPQFTSSGKPVIIIAGDAFVGGFLDEGLPHEFIHGARVGQQYGWAYALSGGAVGHDLDAYPHYKDIITNCK